MSLKSTILQIKNTFDYSPTSVYIKDENFRNLYLNPFGLQQLQIEAQDYLLLTDQEMYYSTDAGDYNKHDYAALQGDIFYQVDTVKSKNGESFFAFSHKIPLKNQDNKTVGVLGFSQYFNHHQLMKHLDTNNAYQQCPIKMTEPAKKLLNSSYNEFGLTPRESTCYYYLLQGISSKGIANKLSISHKTVEIYLAHIRLKMKCHSKAELMAKGFELGLVNILPQEYFRGIQTDNSSKD